MKTKNLLFALLAFIASLPVCAYTWTDSKGLHWDFILQNEGAVLYDEDNSSTSDPYGCLWGTDNVPESLIIPSTVSVNEIDYPVIGIGSCAFYDDIGTFNNVRNIVIPSGVTSIGMFAFHGCDNLESITIPASVAYIASNAFLSFENMKTVYLMNADPSSAVLSSLNTFSHSKPTLYVPAGCLDAYETVGSYFKEVKENFVEFEFEDWTIKVINERNHTARIIWYGGNPSWKDAIVTTPQTATDPSTGTVYSITEIGNGWYDAFSGYGDVDIDEPHSDPFDGCSGWTINISEGIQTINDGAFSCLIDGTIYLPKSLISTNISSDIFYDCYDITVYIPYGFSLESTPSRTVIINPNVSRDISFNDEKVKEICVANWDTNNDGELSEAEAAAVTSLGQVFNENADITSFDELQYFTGLTSIDGEAFVRCTKLQSIVISKSVVNIHSLSFCHCSSLTSIVVDANNAVYNSSGGCNAIIHSSSKTLVKGCKTTVIPSSVTRIGEHAFQGHSDLTTIAIPSTITSIGAQAFCECSSLSSISIPNSVKSIDIFAFAYCSNLTSVTVPSSVMTIGRCVFSGCNNLTSIIVDENNTVYDSRDNCNAIIEKSTGTLIQGCKTTVIPSSVTSIGQNAFCDFESLTSISIPSLVTSIDNYVFVGCSSLTSITFSSLISSFGGEVFYGCSSLVSVVSLVSEPFSIDTYTFDGISSDCVLTVPARTRDAYIAAGWTEDVFKGGIVEMDEQPVFFTANTVEGVEMTFKVISESEKTCMVGKEEDGGAIQEDYCGVITIPSEVNGYTVTRIGKWAFSGRGGLTSVSIPETVTSIGTQAFNFTGLTSITIPNSVTTIEDGVFQGCTGIISILIPSSVTSIAPGTFDCGSLSSIVVESGNTVYDSRNNCNAIIESATNTLIVGCPATTIPNGIEAIGTHAFIHCNGFTSVVIPEGVKSIGGRAFFGCSMTSVSFPESLRVLEGDAFGGCESLTSIVIPSGVTRIDENYVFAGCRGLTSIVVAEGNNYYDSRDNCNAIIEKSTNTLIAGCKNTVIPNTVTAIGAGAFNDFTNLTSIEIPSSVTTIKWWAFHNCGLTSVNIPASVTSIEAAAFEACDNLVSVTVNNPVPVDLSAGGIHTDYVFSNYANATLYVPVGSKSAYESAPYWKDFKAIVEMDPVIDELLMADVRGVAGGKVNLPVSLSNPKNEVAGVQFKLTLPDGVTLSKVSTASRTSAFNTGSTKNSDGSYTVLLYHGNDAIPESDGRILTLELQIDGGMANADYPISIREIVLSAPDQSVLSTSNAVSSVLTVADLVRGDANSDGRVNVADIVAIANYILNNPSARFNATAADVNNDTRVNVADIVGVANLILSAGGNSPRMVIRNEREPE